MKPLNFVFGKNCLQTVCQKQHQKFLSFKPIRWLLIPSIVVLILPMQGCPGPKWSSRIRHIDKSPENFSIYFDGGVGLWCLVSKPQVSSITVSRHLGAQEGEIFDVFMQQTLWSIVATSQEHEDGDFLCEFEYGVVPKGFTRVWLDADKYGYYKDYSYTPEGVPEMVKFTKQSIAYQETSNKVPALIPGETIYVKISGDLQPEIIEVTLPLSSSP